MGWLEELRGGRIEITRRKTYLDNAGASPLTKDAAEAIMNFVNLWQEEGEPWELALDHIIEAKKVFTQFINAPSCKALLLCRAPRMVKCIIICHGV